MVKNLFFIGLVLSCFANEAYSSSREDRIATCKENAATRRDARIQNINDDADMRAADKEVQRANIRADYEAALVECDSVQ